MELLISLAAEPIFTVGNLVVTNAMLSHVLLAIALLSGAFLVRLRLKEIPGRFQSVLEMIYEWLIGSIEKILNNKAAARDLTPFILTLFLFVTLSNWSGLLPGVGSVTIAGEHHGHPADIPLFRPPTSDLNAVLVLALFAMGYVQYLGLKYAGFKGYVSRFVNLHGPIDFFIGILELLGEFTRIISFTFRLFGNIFAGEVLIMVMFFLTITLLPMAPFIPLPFFVLELGVGVVQAFIFCFLTIVFASLAIIPHGHAEEH